ncbi:MAG: hypothetical protein J6Q79_03385 [Clostridia bacterium]|nr:hypothetical protein [Clostridia bacterium]
MANKITKLIKNYLIYPCTVMRITQNYNGKTSHYPHTTGNIKDYPFDEGCKDSNRDYMYCPCDQMKVMRIFGVGTSGTNTIWLESTSPVYFADGTTDYFTMLVTHPNDDDLKEIKVGDLFNRGDKICREGINGATANHLHISGGKGKFSGNGWSCNSNGKYVLCTTKGAYKPEKLFYIDLKFTSVISKGGIAFKNLPDSAYTKKYTPGKYKVTAADVLRITTKPAAKGGYKKFNELSDSAQSKIKKLNNNKPADGYVRGLEFTVTKVDDNWGYNNSGWMCLDYCTKIN